MAGTDFLGSKLLDLLFAGMQRGVSVIYQKLYRLNRIDQTIRGLATKNPRVKTAISDFETISGTYQGNLTVTLKSFLEEIERTGLIEAMVENALIGRQSLECSNLFDQIHFQFFGIDSPAAEKLYKNMMTSFTITLEELSNDPVVSAIVKATHSDLSNRLDQINDGISAILSNANQVNVPKYSDISGTMLKISRGLQQSYRSVRVETNRGQKEVDINRIYIPPKLRIRRDISQITNVRIINQAIIDASIRMSPDLFEHKLEETISQIGYADLAASFQRIVVLGDPGGGKSTLCQMLCFDMAKNTSLMLQFADESRIKRETQRLPIRVILRKFEQARTNESQLTLLNYIVRDIENYAGTERAETRQCVEYLFSTGRAVLAFDGLDEILDTSKRQEFVELVTALCNQYPLCPVIVTSRIVGYEDAPLPSQFEEVLLEKLDEPEVEAYVAKFMAVVGNKPRDECKILASTFIRQTEETANDLRRNPLLLGLMAWLFLANGDVPSNRPEIYKECSILLFEKWDQKRGIHADPTSDFDRSHLFINIASQIYGQPSLAGGVTREWLQRSLQTWFVKLYEDRNKAYQASKAFVDFITGRAWVMSEIGHDIFSFTHQTFLEYFFARYLDDTHDSVSSLLKTLKPRILKSEWNEVAHLSLQLKTHRSLRKQEEALKILTDYVNTSRISKHRLALMAFSARALEYLSPSESKVGEFLEILFSKALEQAKGSDNVGISSISMATHTARERRDYVQNKVENLIVEALGNEDASVALAAARFVNFDVNRQNRAQRKSVLPTALTLRIIDAARTKVVSLRNKNSVHAGLAFSWYQIVDYNAVEKFGFNTFFNQNVLGTISDLDGISGLAIAQTGLYFRPISQKNFDEGQLEAALWTIVSSGLHNLPISPEHFRPPSFSVMVPPDVWLRIYESLNERPRARMGAIFARNLANEWHSRRKNGLLHETRGKAANMGKLDIEYLKPLASTSAEAAALLDVSLGKVKILK